MPDRFGIGVVGFGYWGANLARNTAASRSCDLVAVTDPSAECQEHARVLFPGVATYATVEQLLNDSNVHAVLVATPPSTHAELAMTVLNGGRHVLVEKPFATTSEEAEQIIEAADRNGLVAMPGHTFLYSPAVRVLRELVESGELGNIQHVYSQRLNLGRIRRDCNVLWNLAPHDVSMISYLVSTWPVTVSATSHSFIEPPNDDVYFLTTTAENGISSFIHVSWIDPRKTRCLTVVGDQQMAVFDDTSANQKVAVYDAGVARSTDDGFGAYESFRDFQWRTRCGDVQTPQVEMNEPLSLEIEDFVHCCQTGGVPVASAQSGLHTVQVLEAAERSAAHGGTQERLALDP